MSCYPWAAGDQQGGRQGSESKLVTPETVLQGAVTLGLLCDSRGVNSVVDYLWLCVLLVSP